MTDNSSNYTDLIDIIKLPSHDIPDDSEPTENIQDILNRITSEDVDEPIETYNPEPDTTGSRYNDIKEKLTSARGWASSNAKKIPHGLNLALNPYHTGKYFYNQMGGKDGGNKAKIIGIAAGSAHTIIEVTAFAAMYKAITGEFPSMPSLPSIYWGGENETLNETLRYIPPEAAKNATDTVTPSDILQNGTHAVDIYGKTPSGAEAYIGTDSSGLSIVDNPVGTGNNTTAIAKADRIIYIPPDMNVSDVITSLEMIARS